MAPPPGVSAQRPSNGEPQPAATDAAGTKRDLRTWWKDFSKKGPKKEDEKGQPISQTQRAIFGVPLSESIKYAHVAISLQDENGKPFTYGYVPIVVAKCGIFLKEEATEVEGIFRLAGAERRIKDLMNAFDSPDRYGKGLNWTGYTVHDAANLLRRYINSLPEPIVPLAFYEKFRNPLRNHQAQAVGAMDHQSETKGEFDLDATIIIYQQLITQLPELNQKLLLYLLDLMAVFSSKQDVNRMTAPNLSAIFQPGILNHPQHFQTPSEYRLSQDVLIFLIENQDHFIIGMNGTAADEKIIREIQDPAGSGTAPTTKQSLDRSASTASAASQSVRRFGELRRNASTNSRGSRLSSQSPVTVTPPPASPFTSGSKSGGLSRSNTLPTKKKSASPALAATERFQRFQPPATPETPATTLVVNPATPTIPSPLGSSPNAATGAPVEQRLSTAGQTLNRPSPTPSPNRSPLLRPFASGLRTPSQDRQMFLGDQSAGDRSSIGGRASPGGTPTRERTLSALWSKSTPEGEKKDIKRHNKLQKKRPDGIPTQESRQHGSQPSASGMDHPVSPGPVASSSSIPLDRSGQEQASESVQTPTSTAGAISQLAEEQNPSPRAEGTAKIERDLSSATLKPVQGNLESTTATTVEAGAQVEQVGASSASTASRTTDTGVVSQDDDTDALEITNKKSRRDRWRQSLSLVAKKADTPETATYESSTGAERSTSSVGSYSKARKSFTDESNQSVSVGALSNGEAEDRARSPRRGPLGWFKGKLLDRQDKRDEKERTKSPPARQTEIGGTSSHSLIAATSGGERQPRAPSPSQAPVNHEGTMAPIKEAAEVAEPEATTPTPAPAPAAIIQGPTPTSETGSKAEEQMSTPTVTAQTAEEIGIKAEPAELTSVQPENTESTSAKPEVGQQETTQTGSTHEATTEQVGTDISQTENVDAPAEK